MICKNIRCLHHIQASSSCAKEPIIGAGGECEMFEKGFTHYICLVFAALNKKNYIDAAELTEDLKLGMYYVMCCWDLGFIDMPWGNCRIFMLSKQGTRKGLTFEGILKLPINEEEYKRQYRSFLKGERPNKDAPEAKKKVQPFGWLSPTGVFYESPFGSHEAKALEIIEEKGFYREFHSLGEFQEFETQGNYRDRAADFLSEKKGYALIHNPMGFGRYLVTHFKPLTKAQREFLYSYFAEMGDILEAERYLKNQEENNYA